MGRVKAIWVPCLFQARPTGISQKKITAKNGDMTNTQKLFIYILCDVHFWCKFKEHCRNISGGILDSVFLS